LLIENRKWARYNEHERAIENTHHSKSAVVSNVVRKVYFGSPRITIFRRSDEHVTWHQRVPSKRLHVVLVERLLMYLNETANLGLNYKRKGHAVDTQVVAPMAQQYPVLKHTADN